MLFLLCVWAPAATEVSPSCSPVPLGSSGCPMLQLLCPTRPNASSSSPCAQLHASLGPAAPASSHKPAPSLHCRFHPHGQWHLWRTKSLLVPLGSRVVAAAALRGHHVSKGLSAGSMGPTGAELPSSALWSCGMPGTFLPLHHSHSQNPSGAQAPRAKPLADS